MSQASEAREKGGAEAASRTNPRLEGSTHGTPSAYVSRAVASMQDDRSRRGSATVGRVSREPSLYQQLTTKYIMPKHPYRELVKDIPRRGFLNMSLHNPIRKAAILLIKSKGFEIFILAVILVNCVFMALQSQEPGFNQTRLGRFLNDADIFFQIIFTAEMVIKTIALGFVLRKGSYLRDGFNIVDFTVVVLAFINYAPGVGNYTAIRAVRVLRPLRTISRIKGMKQLVLTLLSSLPLLLDVAALCSFVFLVYGIAAVQLFGGAFRDHCSQPVFNETVLSTLQATLSNSSAQQVRVPSSAVTYVVPPPPSQEMTSYCSGPYSTDITWFINATGALSFRGGSKGMGRPCDGPSPDYPLGLFCHSSRNPYPGFTNFDNILYAWLNVFIVITLDGWSDILFSLQDSLSVFLWPFFVTLIFFSSFFMVNLALAVLYTQFKKESEARKADAAKAAAEREAAQRKTAEEIERRLWVTEVASPGIGGPGPLSDRYDAPSDASPLVALRPSILPNGHGGRTIPEPPASPSNPEFPSSGPLDSSVAGPQREPAGDASVSSKKTTPVRYRSEPAQLSELDSSKKRSSFVGLGLPPPFMSRGSLTGGLGPSTWAGGSSIGAASKGRSVYSALPMQRAGSVEEARVVYKDLLQTHSEWRRSGVQITLRHRVSLAAHRLLCQQWFEGLLVFVILLNTIMMAAEHFGESSLQSAFSTGINYAVTAVFIVELIVKHCAYGPKLYWTNGYDAFDGLIIFASIVDIVVSAVQQNQGASALSALRSLRLLRILKLARSWKELQKVIDAVFMAVGSIGYLSLLFMLIMVIFALLGMQLFGERLQFCVDIVEGAFQACPPGEPCPRYRNCYVPCDPDEVGTWISAVGSPFNDLAYCERFPVNATALKPGEDFDYLGYVGPPYIPRFMFDTFFFSLVTVFACIAQDGWSGIMFDVMRSIRGPGRYFAALYFVVLLVIGLYILLNLFLAVLLDGLSINRDESPQGPGPRLALNLIRKTIEKSKLVVSKVSSRHSFLRTESNGGAELTSPVVGAAPKKSVGFRPSEDVGLPKENGSSPDLHRDPATTPGENARDASTSGSPEREASRRSSRPPTLSEQIRALRGRSLFLLEPDNPVRLALARVVFHRVFDVFIMCIIVCSSLALALDSPQLSPTSPLKKALGKLDIVFTACFALEAVLKIVVLGFALHEGSYMRSGWNLLDLAIVIVGFFIISTPQGSSNRHVRSLRVLRTLRALRPLRLISWNAGMKIVVDSLFQSVPPLGDVLLVCMLVYFIFGVVGIQLFSGLFYECVDLNSGNALDPRILFPPGHTMTKEWCEANGGWHVFQSFPYHYLRNSSIRLPPNSTVVIQAAWQNPPTNFDNIGNALLTLYEIASLELWEVVMWRGMDATSVGQQPVRDNFHLSAIFFILFVMFGSFFILNLFVGVIIDKFNELKQKAENQNILLTDEQQRWVEIQKLMSIVGPKKTYSRPANRFRAWCYDFILSPRVDTFILGCVVLNIAQMTLEWFEMPYEMFAALSYINIIFTGIFVLEAALKLTAVGPSWYFGDNSNRFDFAIIVSSVLTIMLDYGPDGKPTPGQGGAGLNLLRVFRIVRILRLIPRAKGLRTMIQTLIFSLPALWNVGAVMFMFFFIFAVMGMQLFGLNVGGQYLDNKCNFNSFPTALLTLFKTLTGENWPGVMHDAAGDTVQPQCIQMLADCGPSTVPPCGAEFAAGSFYSRYDVSRFHVPPELTLDRCPGNRVIAFLYFCAFTVLCGSILINLIIAIVIDNFEASNLEANLPISKQHMAEYQEAWSKLDPSGSGFIPARKLPALIADLPHPMGAKNSNATLTDIQMIVMTSDIPNRDGRVHFFETLHSLSARIAGTDLPVEEQIKVHSKLSSKLPRSADDIKHTVAHYHAALYVQAAVRGMLARQAVQAHLSSLGLFGGQEPDLDAAAQLPKGALLAAMSRTDSQAKKRGGLLGQKSQGRKKISLAQSLKSMVGSGKRDRGSKISRVSGGEALFTPLPGPSASPSAHPAAVAAAASAFKLLRKNQGGGAQGENDAEGVRK